MTELERKLWRTIVALAREGRTNDMLQVVAIFEAVQHGDLCDQGMLPDHTRALLDMVTEGLFDKYCPLTRFGLAL